MGFDELYSMILLSYAQFPPFSFFIIHKPIALLQLIILTMKNALLIEFTATFEDNNDIRMSVSSLLFQTANVIANGP